MNPYERPLGWVRSRGSAKWSTYGDDCLAAFVAEMDYETAPEVQRAMRDELGAALAGWYQRTASFAVSPERIHSLPDILKGIELAISLFSRPDSAVVVPTASYPPFFAVADSLGREVVEVPMLAQPDGWQLDLERIDAAFAAGAGTLILCNPHNPLGKVFSLEEMRELAEVVERHHARVVADEVHAPLTYPGKTWMPYASVSETAAGHAVSLMSASKGWNLAGLKCAQVALHTEADANAWGTLPPLAAHGASTLGMVANVAAYQEGAAWLEQTVAYLDGNRRRLGELLAERLPAIRYLPPEGTYLAWLDCSALGLERPQAFFLEQAKVAFNDGGTFGAAGTRCVRCNFATSRRVLEEIVERMAIALERTEATVRG
jgi:cystathionine beta-lyase